MDEKRGRERRSIVVMEQAKRQAETISGVSNVAYDLVAVLYNKLDAIAALEAYKRDAEEQGDHEVQTLFEHLQQTERADVERLRGLLVERLS